MISFEAIFADMFFQLQKGQSANFQVFICTDCLIESASFQFLIPLFRRLYCHVNFLITVHKLPRSFQLDRQSTSGPGKSMFSLVPMNHLFFSWCRRILLCYVTFNATSIWWPVLVWSIVFIVVVIPWIQVIQCLSRLMLCNIEVELLDGKIFYFV